MDSVNGQTVERSSRGVIPVLDPIQRFFAGELRSAHALFLHLCQYFSDSGSGFTVQKRHQVIPIDWQDRVDDLVMLKPGFQQSLTYENQVIPLIR